MLVRSLSLCFVTNRGGRTTAHPVAGLVLGGAAEGDGVGSETGGHALGQERQLHFFIQRNVPSISFDEFAPHALYQWLRKLERGRGRTRIERYSVPCAQLARWTRRQLERGWAGQPPAGSSPRQAAAGAHRDSLSGIWTSGCHPRE